MGNLTVDKGDVHVPEDANGLLNRHDERSAQIDLHQLDEAHAYVIATPVSVVFLFASKFLGFALQEHRHVGFFEHGQKHKRHTDPDHGDPIRPPPTERLRDEPANRRADHRAIHRTDTPDRKGRTPPLVVDEVGDRAGRVGDQRTCENGAEEPRDDDARDILRQCRRDDQDREHGRTYGVHGFPAIGLCDGSHDQATNGQAEEI